MLLAKELLPLCEFITTSVVIALGGDPKKVHSEMAVYGFIHQKNCHVANQIQDLFVMLDYLYVLKKDGRVQSNEEAELIRLAHRIVLDVQRSKY